MAIGTSRSRPRRDFRFVWGALTVSLFGAQISTLALPLAAAISLGASPLQIGWLAASGQAPFLLCSLPFGVVVDRATSHRRLLIAADLGRAAALAAVPVTDLTTGLRIELLFGVAFSVGTLNALFDVAHYSFVPSLVGRDRLTAANGKIQASYSAAEATGPGLAGVLIQLLSAALAVCVTVGTFLLSAALLWRVPASGTISGRSGGSAGWRAEMAEGMRTLLGNRSLRSIVVASSLAGLFVEGARALFLLFAVRTLGFGATEIGAVLAAGGAAAVLGGVSTERITTRLGLGPVILGGWLVEAAGMLVTPFVTGKTAVFWLAAAMALGGFGGAVANVNQWSLRQIVTPDHLQARVTASHRCLVYGVYPAGSLVGGVLATSFGLRPAILVLAVGALLAPMVLLRGPVVGLRRAALLAPPTTSAVEQGLLL